MSAKHVKGIQKNTLHSDSDNDIWADIVESSDCTFVMSSVVMLSLGRRFRC